MYDKDLNTIKSCTCQGSECSSDREGSEYV